MCPHISIFSDQAAVRSTGQESQVYAVQIVSVPVTWQMTTIFHVAFLPELDWGCSDNPRFFISSRLLSVSLQWFHMQFHSSFYDSFGCPFLSRGAANSMHLHLEPYWTQSHLLLLVSCLVAFLPSQPSFLTPTSMALATILGYAQGFSRIIVLSLI